MNVIITDGWLSKRQPLQLGTGKIVFISVVLVVLIAGISVGVYKLANQFAETGVSSLWPFSSAGGSKNQDRFVKENIDAMAQRVGEMQAKIIELEALAKRVSGAAGMPDKDATSPKPAGSGGILVNDRSFTSAELLDELAKLEISVQEVSDNFNLAEAHHAEQKLTKLTIPTQEPVPGARIGSRFGWRVDPITGRRALHTGLDFASPTGTPILAAAGGVVVRKEYGGGYGYVVEIEHGEHLLSRYGHTSKQYVEVGDLVKKGQHIADVGSTGRSTGPHLHLEVELDGIKVDPSRFLGRQEDPDNLAQLSP